MQMIQPLLAFMIVRAAGGFGVPLPADMMLITGPAAVLAFLLIAYYMERREVEDWLAAEERGSPAEIPGGHPWLMLLAWAGIANGTSWVAFCAMLVGFIPGAMWLLAIAPWVALRALLCRARYPLERVTGRPWSLAECTSFHVRVTLMVLIPIILAHTIFEALFLVPSFRMFLMLNAELAVPLGMALILVFVFSFAPLLLRVILGARGLEPGPLRSRLEEYGERSGFRPNDILLWRTGNSVTNAMFIGIVPGLRYVVLTDALIDRLSEDQTVAVYAHEAGHGKCRHTILFLVMALGLITASAALTMFFDSWLAPVFLSLDQDSAESLSMAVGIVTQIAILGSFLLLGLGWISRRFETEADLYAVETLGDAEQMQTALESVGLHSGSLQAGKGGMRHFGIGTRIGLINRYNGEQDFRRRFDSVLRRCRGGIIGLLALGLLGLAWHAPGKLAFGAVRMDLIRGYQLEETDREQAAVAYRETADASRDAQDRHPQVFIDLRRDEVAALAALIDLHQKAGRDQAAAALLDEVAGRVIQCDRNGNFNLRYLRLIQETVEGRGDRKLARRLVSEYDQMSEGRDPGDASSVQLYNDLFLVLRALGADRARPGEPSLYQPAARLLLTPESERTEELRAAAARDVANNAHRLRLLERIDGDLAASL